jgi:hypothetical protein
MCQDGSRKVLYQLALSGSAHRLFLFGTSIQQLPANPKHRHSSADGQFPFTPPTCAMDADCAPATSTEAAGIQS